jgi:hypothetical protein
LAFTSDLIGLASFAPAPRHGKSINHPYVLAMQEEIFELRADSHKTCTKRFEKALE